MWGNRNFRRLPHRLEPRQSTPTRPLRVGGATDDLTSSESIISATGRNRYQGTATPPPVSTSNSTQIVGISESVSSGRYYTAPPGSPASQSSSIRPLFSPIIGQNTHYCPTDEEEASKGQCEQSPGASTSFKHFPQRRGRGIANIMMPPPVENLFDNRALIDCDLFVQGRYAKNYGRPKIKHTRASRGAIVDRFLGEGGIKDNPRKIVLDPFSSPSSSSTSSSSSSSSDGRHSWF